MLDRGHLGRSGENARGPVNDDGIVLPSAFPELVDDLQEFVGNRIALVMRNLGVVAQIAGSTFQRRGDNVPADAATRQMVERRQLASQRIGLFIGCRDGDGEAQMLRRRRHGGYDQQRIGGGRLHALLERAF